MDLSKDELSRYSRHFVLPEVGFEGQRRLKAARILIVGAGGLGSPAALYLTAAGVGHLGLVDFDKVEASNLQRQILHSTSDVGRSKLDSASDRLSELNPHIELSLHELRLGADNALDLIGNYDLVIDGSDNFSTRYLVSDAAVLLGKPNVYGSIYRFEGQVSVFDSSQGPCYRCLFPQPPPRGETPNCSEAGVLGVLPGVVGTLQATEAIKLILRIGTPLLSRLLIFDALQMRFREMELKKEATCPACGKNPTIKELRQEQASCSSETQKKHEWEISLVELQEQMQRGDRLLLVDVRETEEFKIVNLGGKLIPLAELSRRYQELDSKEALVVYCHHGTRSLQAVKFLKQKGFENVRSLAGGIDAWSAQIDPNLPRY